MSNHPSTDEPFGFPAGAGERITLDEYRRRAAKGGHSTSNTFELLEGVVVPKCRQTLRHETAVEKLRDYIGIMIPNGWHLLVQQPIACGDSQPEPDLASVCDVLDEYANRPPKAENVSLVVEVADGSLLADRTLKGRIYARAGVVCYWLLNLIDSQLEVFSNPSGPVPMPGYREKRVYRTEDKLSLVIGLDDLGTVRVGDILP
ncbi:MAG TPA: Uma2 family endonuclease [Pirellulales bacterium]|nr:Uma2 family endonuclease [Pirellulales bacterium]